MVTLTTSDKKKIDSRWSKMRFLLIASSYLIIAIKCYNHCEWDRTGRGCIFSNVDADKDNNFEFPGVPVDKFIKFENSSIPIFQWAMFNRLSNNTRHIIVDARNSNIRTMKTDIEHSIWYKMDQLDVSQNNIANLEKNSFNFDSLEHLNISFNKIETIDDNFAYTKILYSEIRTIDLSHNNLRNITGVFDRIIRLHFLDLSYNMIEDIEGSGGFNYIRELNLNNNQITLVNSGILIATRYIERLNLAYNQIQRIPSRAFEDHTLLQYLNLEHNKITVIESRAFELLLGQTIIRTSKHEIYSNAPANSTQIFLNNNNLTKITRNMFGNCYDCIEIDLSDNKIDFIAENAFENSPKLEIINLNKNKLTTIVNGTFSYLNLQKVTFQGNPIRNLEESALPKSLKVLDLSRNPSLNYRSNMFEGLASLSYLNLRETNLSEIEFGLFSHQINLTTLDISYNNLLQFNFIRLISAPSMDKVLLDGNHIKSQSIYHLNTMKINYLGIYENDLEDCGNLISFINECKKLGTSVFSKEAIKDVKTKNIGGIRCN